VKGQSTDVCDTCLYVPQTFEKKTTRLRKDRQKLCR